MNIGECHKCGEPVQEGTLWDISKSLGFTCESCNSSAMQSHQDYLNAAKWLKENNQKVREQIKQGEWN